MSGENSTVRGYAGGPPLTSVLVAAELAVCRYASTTGYSRRLCAAVWCRVSAAGCLVYFGWMDGLDGGCIVY